MESEGKTAGGRAVQRWLILWLSVLWEYLDCIYGPVFHLPHAHRPRFSGWRLGGVTFNLNLSGQFFACGRAVSGEDILRWNSTLKTCKDRIDIGPPVAQFDEFSKAT